MGAPPSWLPSGLPVEARPRRAPVWPTRLPHGTRQLAGRPGLPLALLALGLSLARLAALEDFFRDHLGCRLCLSLQALPHELQWLALLAALHLGAQALPLVALRRLLRAALVALVVYGAVDLAVLLQFHVRLTPDRLWTFAHEGAAVLDHLRLSGGSPAQAGAGLVGALVLLGLLLRYVWRDSPQRPRPARAALLSGLCLAGAALATPWQRPDYHLPYVRHAGAVLLEPSSELRPYSAAFTQALARQPRPGGACVAALGAQPDIVVVLVESLSMFHSKLFSGLNDWTPMLDAEARQGRRFTQFHANGVTTEQGLVALLTGEPPLPRGPGHGRTALQQFAHPAHSVPRLLREAGYDTAFLTTGNLGFMDKGTWLRGLGFGQVEGHDAAFYRGMPRFNFDAAVDDALYARAWQWLQQPQTAPRFLLLETVTTHAPFIDPDTGTRSQERVVRRADRALGAFIAQLRQSGFFEHGVVLVLGDHRGMVPMDAAERARFGDRGFARVPLVMLGLGAQGVETAAFSQTDLLPSLRHWVGQGRPCVGPDQGLFLPQTVQAPRCIHTRRSYSDHDDFIACGPQDHVARLDGDDTRWARPTATPPAGLLDEVNRLRAGLGW